MKQASVLVLVLALGACGREGSGKVSLSKGVAAAAPASATAVGSALAIGDRVTLDRARFLIRKVVLEGEGSGDDAVVRAGPLVIDLSGAQLDGGVALLFDQSVPAGTYEELTFQVHKLTPGEGVADADFQPLGRSMILDLTVDGAPFQFTTDLTAVAEVPGPLVVPDGGAINVTVTVDPGRWFTAADGSFLDPRVEANRSQLEWNLKRSIRGFEDDDHDGQPDPR